MANDKTEIQVVDVLGKTVMQHSAFKTQHYTLDVSSLNSGVYFITLTGSMGLPVTKKLIIE